MTVFATRAILSRLKARGYEIVADGDIHWLWADNGQERHVAPVQQGLPDGREALYRAACELSLKVGVPVPDDWDDDE